MTRALRGPCRFELTIPGQPAGAGSKVPMPKGRMVRGRFKAVFDKIGRPVFYVKPDSELTLPWMQKVKSYAEAERHRTRLDDPLDGALWLDVSFFEVRPVSHFFNRKSGRVLRPDAPAFPHVTKTHDKDKMRRAISDSLTQAGVLADDKRVVAGAAWKFYADDPPRQACAVVRVGHMLHQTVLEAGIVPPPPGNQEQL